MKLWVFVFLIVLGLFTAAFGEADHSLRGVITGRRVNLRESDSLTAGVLTVMPRGSIVIIENKQGEWVQVRLLNGLKGWVYHRYIVANDPGRFNSRQRFTGDLTTLSSFALRYLGTKYRYSGATPEGFDCSGFTMYIYARFGWRLPHNAAAQMNLGAVVARPDLRPGDLVFFKTLNSLKINHVGIYLGDGDFIHAASGSGNVKISNIERGYYKYRFCGARRLR